MSISTTSSSNKNQSTEGSVSEALSLLVININRFNTAFAENTQRLNDVIDKLNTPTEAEKAMRQAFTLPTALEIRNVAEQQRVTLESMHSLMNGYMTELQRTAALTDAQMGTALQSLKDSTASNIESLSAMFVAQSEQLKRVLKEEKEEFDRFNLEMSRVLSRHLEQMPQLAAQLNSLAAIPERLDKLIGSIEASQTQAMINVNRAIRQALSDAVKESATTARPSLHANRLLAIPLIVSVICLVVITIKLLLL